jgi:uncharacterized protein (UPF0335 family)
MAVGLMARIARLEARVHQLDGRVGDVEGEQHAQGKRMGRIEKAMRTVLSCLERMDANQRRFHNRTAATIAAAISATRQRS